MADEETNWGLHTGPDEPKWVQGMPNKAGFYWAETKSKKIPVPVEVYHCLNINIAEYYVIKDKNIYLADSIKQWWFYPIITPPERE